MAASESTDPVNPDHDVYGEYGPGGGWMRAETTGGILLIIGAFLALAWANTPWRDTYFDVAGYVVGPESLHLDLTIAEWAADGLLAIFFFVVGVELKAEFVTGSLRHPRKASLPIIAAAGGMAAPALIFTGVILVSGEDALRGWAIPTATDIAFALAVLAVVGRGLPTAMRTFLMTLAVVDDLLAITIIAIFYTDDLSFLAFGGMLIPLALFALLVQKRITAWYVLAPIAIVCWVLMHASGVHATIAGVLLGFTVPAILRKDEAHSLTHQFEWALRPLSQCLALPVFAFFSAGVSIADAGGFGALLTDPVAIGVASGLVLGKIIGIWGTVAILVRTTKMHLEEGVTASDMLALAMLAGIGFTVSLLITELAFGHHAHGDHARIAVLAASVIAAAIGSVAIRLRIRARRNAAT